MKFNRENNEDILNIFTNHIYIALLDFNKDFTKHFQFLKKSKMNFLDLKMLLKPEDLTKRFLEVLNFIRNNIRLNVLKISSHERKNDEDRRGSSLDTPKKGISRTLYKKPTTLLSQFKNNEKRPRKSFNLKNSDN